MKIIKYKKLKTNTYKLVLDNKEEIVLYDDTIIKYDLLRTKEINDLDSIIKYNKSIESYYIAIKYITRKLRTEKEVRNKLIDYPSKAIDNTIERLIKEGYINDKNYLKISIKDYINITSYGPNKIVYKLIPLGFTKEEIYNELDNYDKEIFINKLDKLIDKKIKTNTKYSISKLKEKIIVDLSNQGYNKNDIYNILTTKDIKVNKSILTKEYNKIKKQLSRKYEGYDLKNKLTQKLVSKGFNYEEVKNLVGMENDYGE